MDAKSVSKTIRRLQTAEGYLELNLPERALAELSAIQDRGPFEPAIILLEGEVLKTQERYDDALVPLKRAAQMIPSPLNKRAWRSIAECYRKSGRDELAEIAEVVLNTEEAPPQDKSPTVVRVAFVPLPMLSSALRELFTELGAEKSSNEGSDED